MRKLSVCIGRFQVPALHEGHLYLLREAEKRGDVLLVMIGCRNKADINNPMDYTIRRSMIKESFPNAYTLSLFDFDNDDRRWSREVDSLLLPHINDYDITLYGSRDSFIKKYFGSLKYEYIESDIKTSGTEIRKNIKPIVNSDFRSGVIWAIQNYLKNKML